MQAKVLYSLTVTKSKTCDVNLGHQFEVKPPLISHCAFMSSWVANFSKKIGFLLNIPVRFGIIITTIENVECKIGGFEVKIQHLITIDQLPLTNLPEKANYRTFWGINDK